MTRDPVSPKNDHKDLEVRKKRILFRCGHRGTKEMDTILSGFCQTYLDGMDAAQVADFEAILMENDPDLYNWISRREDLPEGKDSPLIELLINFKFSRTIP